MPTFGIYYIDRDYIDALRKNDNPNVPYADYEDQDRQRKFYCGPVTTQDGMDYYVPVSHSIHNLYIHGSAANGVKEYHGLEIYSYKTKEPIGCLDFKYMIPCADERFITPCNYDDRGDYGKAQIDFCMNNKSYIQKLANETYNNITSGDYESLKDSVDFEKAIDASWDYADYIDDIISEIKDKLEKPIDEIIDDIKKQPDMTIEKGLLSIKQRLSLSAKIENMEFNSHKSNQTNQYGMDY